nr:hypothetical protein [Tanacetum cinerariifolium]GEX99678.1 hypothetical protein [Tanacetum cinerariifolium]
MEITTTIDGKSKIVTKASIRRHLKLEDYDGICTLPTTRFLHNLLLWDEAASTSLDVRHGGAATTITSLDTGQGSGNINKTSSIPHDSLLSRVESLKADLKQTIQVYDAAYIKLIIKVKKLDKIVKSSQARRRAKIVVSEDEDDLEDPSKQGRKIAKIDQDPDISLVQHDVEIQGRHGQDMEFESDFDAAKEVFTTKKGVSTAEPVSTAGASVSTASVSTASLIRVSTTETLMYIRRSETKIKDKALRLQEQLDEEERQRNSRQLRRYSFDELKDLFETTMRILSIFVPMESEVNKEIPNSGPAEELGDKDTDELSQEELQQLMIIVPDERMNVEALQTKYPIIDWEDEVSDLKKVIKKLTSRKVSLDQLISEQVPGNIIRALGGRGKQKDNNSPKDIVFLKSEESLNENSPESTS